VLGGVLGDIRSVVVVGNLQAEDPLRFQAWQVAQMKLAAAEKALAQENERQAAIHQQHFQRWAYEQEQILVRDIPEWKDQAKAQKEFADIREYLVRNGIPQEEAAQLIRADLVKLARKAMLYDRAKVAASSPAKPQPGPVIRPGTAPAKNEGQMQRIVAAQQQFKKTGSVHDAARLLAARRG
jgi:hypothetical protein